MGDCGWAVYNQLEKDLIITHLPILRKLYMNKF